MFATGRAAHRRPRRSRRWPQAHTGRRCSSASGTCCACRWCSCGTSSRPRPTAAQKRIGVLYLDSREGGVLKSPATRERARGAGWRGRRSPSRTRALYREASEKARLEHELQIAAEIQQALMPPGEHAGRLLRGGRGHRCRAGRSAATSSTTSNWTAAAVGVALGDVSGKGAPAALLTAVVQGMFTVEAGHAGRPGRHPRQDQPRR
ncbi:MAG: serine/threonine-protein phosphatase [Ignavibacteriales bacterium]|nr:serine/threonine-protein phosphatase [Ignavibacteriales bacterium]